MLGHELTNFHGSYCLALAACTISTLDLCSDAGYFPYHKPWIMLSNALHTPRNRHFLSPPHLELLESLDGLSCPGQNAENVESYLEGISSFVIHSEYRSSYSLAERSALANSDLITLFHTEGRGNMSGEIGVSLLVSGVLGDEVEIFSAHNDGSVHLGRDDGTGQDTASNGNQAGEWAFLVC